MRAKDGGALAEPVPPEPWRSFLKELDDLLKAPIELRCLGGFVVTQQYGIGRETSDIDFLSVIAQSPDDDVEALAGIGSKLNREDVLRLARAGYLDAATLKERYHEELRPYLLNRVPWHDKTLELWLEMAWPTIP
jgi:hypothetical protein